MKVQIIAISIIVITLIASISAVVLSLHEKTVVKYKNLNEVAYRAYYGPIYDTCCNIKEYAGNIFYTVSEYGKIHIHTFLNFQSGIYESNYSINPPEAMSDEWMPVTYLSNSVVYVGARNGKIYYADPVQGKLIWSFDLRDAIPSVNTTNYYILWGNSSGNMYVLSNNTIYYLHQNRKLEQWRYNFTGLFDRGEFWNGGFILKFYADFNPENGTYRGYNVYYVKNGNTIWNFTIPLKTRPLRGNFLRIYIHNDTVYYYHGCNLMVYKEGRIFKTIRMSGDIDGVHVIGKYAFIITYNDTKNMMYVLNENCNIIKKESIFDLAKIGFKEYMVHFKIERVSIYKTKTGYVVYLYSALDPILSGYTCSDECYIPLRIVHLANNFNIVSSEYAHVYLASAIFPYIGKNKIILVSSEYPSVYIADIEKTEEPDNDGIIGAGVISFSGILALGYFYSRYKEEKMRIEKYKKSL